MTDTVTQQTLTCNHPSRCMRPCADSWGGFCAWHKAQSEQLSAALQHDRKVRQRAERRSQQRTVFAPTSRRCIVETLVAMYRAAEKPCRAEDLVLVAWARWPSIFSVAGAGTPSDHKARSALSKAQRVVSRVGPGEYVPTTLADRYSTVGPPERECSDASEAIKLLQSH